MRRVLFIGITLLLVASCGPSKRVSINTLRPADINLPSYIQSITLVDRTRLDKDFWNIAEGVLTGELPEADKAAVQQSLSSLKSILRTSPRFQDIKISQYRLKGNSLTMAFPEPLSWATIENLCSRHNSQAVLAIEVFDTDFIVTEASDKVTKTIEEDGEEKEITVTEYSAEAVGSIKMGIRFYDPKNREIVDQQIIRDQQNWRATAETKAGALAQLIGISQAIQRLSADIGSDYAYKIAPLPVHLSRSYYGKSKKSIYVERGARHAEVGEWKEAIDTWKEGLNQGAPTKARGKLCYNIAVGYEILGDFKQATDWAQRSYVRFENKQARRYVRTLDERAFNNDRLEEQLGE